MALWTDGVFITVDDLLRIDSEIVEVSTAEKITLVGSNGLLRGSIEEASSEILKLVICYGGYLNTGDMSANHMAAVLNTGSGNSVRQKVGLQQIVVSGEVDGQWNWIKHWAVFWTLKTFYRDAFGRVSGDRYKAKMYFYKEELQRRVTPNITALGIPVVIRPLARPGALFERDAGAWSNDNVEMVAGAGTLDNTHSRDVAITYCDMSQPNFYVNPAKRNNSESDGSDRITVEMEVDKVISVDIESLGPPTGAQHPSQMTVTIVAPLAATHWNVYVGNVGGPLYLQNATPIPIDVKYYELLGDPVLSGPTIGIGQYADRRLSLVPTRQRA